MKRILALALVAALVGLGVPAPVFAGQQHGSLHGVAKDNAGRPTGDSTVRLRSVTTGQVAGTTKSGPGGLFSFTDVPAGNYVVEVVDATGKVIATSASVTVAAGAAVTGVVVSAAGAASAAVAATGGGLGAFFTSTTGVLLIAGGAGLATGIIVATRSSSK
ncbi:MAG: carboxypeptidase-like regulatory domain-containing protein [Bacteroidales bacterium]